MIEKESPLRRFDRGLLAAIRIAVALLLAMMFAVIMWEVVARYVLARPAFWTEEFARYVMFYLVLIGSAAAIRQEKHPSLTFVIQKFSAGFRRKWKLVLDGLVFLVLAVIFWQGCVMAVEEWIGKTPALRISFFWVYLALPIGACLMMVEIVAKNVLGEEAGNKNSEEVSVSEGD
jgi:TRAP-type C4-dicarboxylate transport system permease small subunit